MTDLSAHFSREGATLNLSEIYEESPPKFLFFVNGNWQYIFAGNEVDVIYD